MMILDEVETRANVIEEAMCKRLNINSEEFIMTLFESGCDFAERFYKSTAMQNQGFDDTDFMTSNVFWYWYAKSFMRSCEIFLNSTYDKMNFLMALVNKTPWPEGDIYRKMIQELTLKKERK